MQNIINLNYEKQQQYLIGKRCKRVLGLLVACDKNMRPYNLQDPVVEGPIVFLKLHQEGTPTVT